MKHLSIKKFGNSAGVILPKEVLERLRVDVGDELFLIEAADGSLTLTPYDPEFAEQMKLAERGMKKYRNTLKALSE
jgi:putative addiction module antidote